MANFVLKPGWSTQMTEQVNRGMEWFICIMEVDLQILEESCHGEQSGV